jgi:hypothetical protein
MKPVIMRLFSHSYGVETERGIDEELRFHLELSTQELVRQGMSFQEAKDAALERLGDVERIRIQCAEIVRRGRLSIRVLKFFLIVVFLLGVLVRSFGTEVPVMHVADTLIAVAIMSRLLLYVRGLNPSSFRSRDDTSSPLMLNGLASIPVSDQRRPTPVERDIFDK